MQDEHSLEIMVNEEFPNIAQANANALIAAYGAPFIEAGEILSRHKDIKVTDESQVDLMKQAKADRLALKKIRTGVENKRVELKADYLVVTKAIDGIAKYIKDTITPAEQYLETQEKFAEFAKAARDAKILQERTEKLMQYTDNISAYNLEGMEEATFTILIADIKAAYDARIAREEKEKADAEKLRLEKEAEDKKIREENERLRAEAAEKEKIEADEKARREAAEAKLREEQEAKLAEERAKTEEERKKREAIEKEQADKLAADAREKASAEEAERAALQAPDKEKILKFNNALELIRKEKLPVVSSNKAKSVVALINEMLIKMEGVIEQKIGEL